MWSCVVLGRSRLVSVGLAAFCVVLGWSLLVSLCLYGFVLFWADVAAITSVAP